MQIIKRVAIALTFILALITIPAAAEEGITFPEEPIPDGVNHSFLITECGVPIIVGVAVWEGPEVVKNTLVIISEGDLPIPMEALIDEIIIDYNANGPTIELSDLMDRHCA